MTVPEQRLLLHRTARRQHAALTRELRRKRLFDAGEGIHVLDFAFRAERGLPERPRADVCIHAQTAFFHVAIADIEIEQYLLERPEIRPSLLGRTHVRFAHDFHQRNAAAIQVHRCCALVAIMDGLASILFHVRARNADHARLAVRHEADVERTMLRDRLVVLRDLVALGQVGIEVVLPRKD